MNDESKRVRMAIQKRLSTLDLDPGVEHLIYMEYKMFMERLAEEAGKSARQKKQSKIKIDDIMEVTADVIQEFRG